MKCPRCGSENIATERRLNGNSLCVTGCGYNGPTGEFHHTDPFSASNMSYFGAQTGKVLYIADKMQMLEAELKETQEKLKIATDFIEALSEKGPLNYTTQEFIDAAKDILKQIVDKPIKP